jgi:hypothetical protein
MRRKAKPSRKTQARRARRFARRERDENRDCWHRWEVFTATIDNRRWSYCKRCGALHPGMP